MNVDIKPNDWVAGERTEVHFFDDTQCIRTERYGFGGLISNQEYIVDKKEYFRRKLKGE